MYKEIRLLLNKFPTIPNSLRVTPAVNAPVGDVKIDVARLYHHYYLDTRGFAPPKPDPASFEHLDLLLPCSELRIRGDGFGVGTAFRQHRSNELGQALCRWFLYEHLNVTYFAHMEAVLDRRLHPGFSGLRVERSGNGDTPDYVCAENTLNVSLAEAKGRVTSVSFGNADFASWRKQFDRVVVKDRHGALRSVKGFIVATRFATETNTPSLKSSLFAEDPASPGEESLGEAPELGSMVVALHYAEIAAKIRQPLLSRSLMSGVPVPREIQFPAAVWEFQLPPLFGKRFVGGYFPDPNGVAPLRFDNGGVVFSPINLLRLDIAGGTFFGVEEGVFKVLCAMARSGDQLALQVPQLPDDQFIYSGMSLLRDGSVIGPLEFFRPVGFPTY